MRWQRTGRCWRPARHWRQSGRADADSRAGVGRSLTAVGFFLEQTGKTDQAVATYRKAEGLLAGPTGSAPDASRGAVRPGAMPRPARLAAAHHGPRRRRPLGLPPGPRRPGGSGWDRGCNGPGPATTWQRQFTASPSSCRRRARFRTAKAEYRKAMALYQELAERKPRRRRDPQPTGDHPLRPRQPAIEYGPVGGGGGRIPRGGRICIRSWRTKTPPSPSSADDWPTATPALPSC